MNKNNLVCKFKSIICSIFGHKYVECYDFIDYSYKIRYFNYGRKGGKRRPQIYKKRNSGNKVMLYCERCGYLTTIKRK